MENRSGINCQELSALGRILNRVLTADETVNFIDWVGDAYDALEVLDSDTSITMFKNTLMSECVNVLDRMPAYEKFKCGCQEFMTADELSSCLARCPLAYQWSPQ